MKNRLILFLLILSLGIFAQEQQQANNTYSKTEIDLKLQLQQQEVQSLQKDMAGQKESVKESIDRQGKYVEKIDSNVSWWIASLAIFMALIGIGVTVFAVIINRRTGKSKKEVDEEVTNIKNLKNEVEEEIASIKKLKDEINTQKIEIEKIKDEAHSDLRIIKKDKEELNKIIKETVEKISLNKESEPEPQQKEEVKKVVKEIKETKTEAEYSSYDWSLKGYNANMEKKYSDASFYYQKAIELKPDYASAYNNWGNALTDLAKQKDDEPLYNEGIEKYRKAIELKPDYASAYYNWGNALSYLAKQNGDESLYYESIEKYRKAIELKSDHADAYCNWGNALTDLAKQKDDESLYYESIEKYQKAIELKPDDAFAYNNWGATLINRAWQEDNLKEKEGEIVELLNKAETLEKGVGSYNFTCLYALMNEKEVALDWLEKSLQYVKRFPREDYEQEKDFNNIKEDPRFKALLDKYFQNESTGK